VTVLITGGMGFIGLHTARAFVDAGEDVVITWYQTWREPDFIKDEFGKRVIIEKGDVSQGSVIRDIAKKHKVDGIVHLAVPGVAALSAADDYRTNMTGLIDALEAAREAEVRRICVASSIAVYHSMGDGPYSETDRLPMESANPTETYKKAWEILGMHYASRTGIELINMRIGGIWGPLYHSGMNLPSRVTHAAVNGVEPEYLGGRVPFRGDNADIFYVKDTARAIQTIYSAETLEHNIYNVGAGHQITNGDIESAISKAVPGSKAVFQQGDGPAHKKDSYMKAERLASLGFKSQWSVDDAIADYVGWLQAGNEK
jgi:UDP-glucose 4-epimerase